MAKFPVRACYLPWDIIVFPDRLEIQHAAMPGFIVINLISGLKRIKIDA